MVVRQRFSNAVQFGRLLFVVALFLVVASAVPAQTFAQPQWTYRGGGPTYQNYVVRNGDTLLAIAYRFGVDVNALKAVNGLRSADRLSIGQVILIPIASAQTQPPTQASQAPANLQPLANSQPPAGIKQPHDGPSDKLIPDSEAVFSPAYADFDIAAFVARYNGYLASYRESVDGDMLTGAQIVQLVAERLSVGPRVLLTMLEMQGGWVTASKAGQVENIVGYGGPSDNGLYSQLYNAGTWMNRAYYYKVSGQLKAVDMPDGTRMNYAASINPGTAAVQNLLAHQTNYDNLLKLLGPLGFKLTYQKLFGDPIQYAIEPLVPSDLQQPSWRVPWSDGVMWFYTGGPHQAWGDGTPRAAVDFGPTEALGCEVSPQWAAAVAMGRITASEHARVMLNLSGTSFQGNGWSLMYMHMASDSRIRKGTSVFAGDRIGHPSCEGGLATGSHLHVARLYNGQWMDVDGAVPMNLSGWTFHNLPNEYDGTASRLGDSREAATFHRATFNGIMGESSPALGYASP